MYFHVRFTLWACVGNNKEHLAIMIQHECGRFIDHIQIHLVPTERTYHLLVSFEIVL